MVVYSCGMLQHISPLIHRYQERLFLEITWRSVQTERFWPSEVLKTRSSSGLSQRISLLAS